MVGLAPSATALGHVLTGAFVDPGSRTFALGLAVALVVAWARGAWGDVFGPRPWRSASVRLDVGLLVVRQCLGLLLPVSRLGLGYAVGAAVVGGLDRGFGVPVAPDLPVWLVSIALTVTLFVAWDASRWVLHRWMHEIPVLWAFHQVHHSADVLTPLTFHRVHPVESVLYELRDALVSGIVGGAAFWLWRGQAVELTVLGVNALGFVANTATGNLRHSHVWLRFPAVVERWLLSPAQHQLHHGIDPRHTRCNFGTWLSLWDRLAGSLVLAPETPVREVGLPAEERNHEDDLWSALVGPVRAVFAGSRRWVLVGMVLALAAAGRAAAEPAENDEDEDSAGSYPAEDDAAYEIVVLGPQGVPHVGGSAHVVTEEELERFHYDDLQRVLVKVPGVQVRGEDGFGLRPNIGMRGGSSDRSAKIALLQDGIPIAPAPYAAPAAYYFPLASRIVGIEVFKGAGSIRYGPQTIGGAVDLRTRGVPTAPEGRLDLGVGLRSTAEAHATAGFGSETLGGRIEGAHLSTRGFKHLDGGGPTGFSRQDLAVRLGASTGSDRATRAGVRVAVGVGHESSDETYLGLSAGDFAEDPYRRYAASALDHMRWTHTEARIDATVARGPFTLTSTVYHHYLGRVWRKLNGFVDGPDLHDLLVNDGGGASDVYLAVLGGEIDSYGADQELAIGTNDRTFHNGGLNNVVKLRWDRERVGSELELGLRVHLDDAVRLHTEDAHAMVDGRPVPTGDPTTLLLDAHTTARSVAAYAAEDARIGRVHVLPGVRVEQIRTAAGTRATGAVDPVDALVVLPGMGVYAEALRWLDVFGGIHRGFSPVEPGSAADARPETAWSLEAGLRAGGARGRAEIVGFRSMYDNLAGACTLSSGCTDAQLGEQFSAGAADVTGLETLAELSFLLPHGITLGGTATYTFTLAAFATSFDSEFPQWGAVDAGDGLPYVPAHQGSASVLAGARRVTAVVSAVVRGPMRDVAGSEPLVGDSAALGAIPGMVQLDAAVHAQLTPSVDTHLTATNVTDAVILESWRPFGARPAAPLQLMLGVTVSRPAPR